MKTFILLLINIFSFNILGVENKVNLILDNKLTHIDTNGDGRVDYQRILGKKGEILEVQIDWNKDGKMDHITTYLNEGDQRIEKIDANYDGVFEKTIESQFLFGKIVSEISEIDVNQDRIAEERIEKNFSYSLNKVFVLTVKGDKWNYTKSAISTVNFKNDIYH